MTDWIPLAILVSARALPRCRELLAEPGIEIDHVTVYRWGHRGTPLLAETATRIGMRAVSGDRWWVNETYVKASSPWPLRTASVAGPRLTHRRAVSNELSNNSSVLDASGASMT